LGVTHCFEKWVQTFRKPEGTRPFGMPRDRLEDNKMGLSRSSVCGVGDWFHLSQDRDQWWAIVNMAMSFQVP
jgi:hypothetical protein